MTLPFSLFNYYNIILYKFLVIIPLINLDRISDALINAQR